MEPWLLTAVSCRTGSQAVWSSLVSSACLPSSNLPLKYALTAFGVYLLFWNRVSPCCPSLVLAVKTDQAALKLKKDPICLLSTGIVGMGLRTCHVCFEAKSYYVALAGLLCQPRQAPKSGRSSSLCLPSARL